MSCAIIFLSLRFGLIKSHLFKTTIAALDRKSTRLNSSHTVISYAVFCLKKKKPFRSAPSRKPSLPTAVQHRNADAEHAHMKQHAYLNAAYGDGATACDWTA